MIPLSNGFTITSMLGAIVCGIYTLGGTLPPDWGFTLTFMFIIFTVASLLSVMPSKDEVRS